MGRKNNRRDGYVPLDLTPIDIPKPRQSPSHATWREVRDTQAKDYNEREERQRKARVAQGIDWSVCVIPGCGEANGSGFFRNVPKSDRRNPDVELPICYRHSAVIVQMVLPGLARDERFVEALADLREELDKRQKREEAEVQARFMARENGEIYFVRIGELVKVGWTRDLWSRLKSYGASAELLVSYPATRQDETTLHRQLTPARAKGREWYEDGQVIAMFVEQALSKYGQPQTFDGMWTKPKRIVAGKNHR